MSVEFTVVGLDNIRVSMEELVKLFPDDTEREFKRVAYSMRASVHKKIRERTDPITGNLETKGVKVDPVKGFGKNKSIDIYGNQPHFHLIEHGHEIIDPKTGENKGFVPGFNVMADTVAEFQSEYPEKMDELVERLMKKKGLLK